MATSNKYFGSPSPRPQHPRIRAWRSYREDPAVHHVEVEVRREKQGLTVLPARLFVSFCREDGKILKQDEAPWELELESWLIDEEKARSSTVENEKLRFSLLLKPAFRPILLRYGDGYFNAVLVTDLKNGPFGNHPEVADMLHDIHVTQPHKDSKAECERLIDHELSNVARRLLELYDGDRDVAEDILGGAIAWYLDDRFSVRNSRLLGLV